MLKHIQYIWQFINLPIQIALRFILSGIYPSFYKDFRNTKTLRPDLGV